MSVSLPQISQQGRRNEVKAAQWLRHHGFTILKSFKHPHSDHYDILAKKGSTRWIIEVKSMKKPNVRVDNLTRMVDTPNINRIGLMFMREHSVPLLFELSKMSIAARKAWAKIHRRESNRRLDYKRRARKAWRTIHKNQATTANL